jgi:hypothetical protein
MEPLKPLWKKEFCLSSAENAAVGQNRREPATVDNLDGSYARKNFDAHASSCIDLGRVCDQPFCNDSRKAIVSRSN